MARRTIPFLLLALAFAVPGAPVAGEDALAPRLAAAVASKSTKACRASVGVWDATTGETLHETNGAATRRTASVMKVATTSAALLRLGPQAELATEVVAASGPDGDGALRGDLVVRGGGDPGFNHRERPDGAEAALRDMARAVRAAGVRRVEGGLVLDDTAFPGPRRHRGWEWDDGEWDWWRAPVSSLFVTDACVEVEVLPGAREGETARVRTTPATQAVRFACRVASTGSVRRATIAFGRTAADGTIPVTGTMPLRSAGNRFEIACVDPAVHFGDVFLRVLREEGVEVAGGPVVVRGPESPSADGPRVVAADPGDLVRLARHATAVADVVRVANKRSQNLYAEVLLRALGRAEGDASFEGGCRAVRSALGFAPDDATFRQVDGSGLARENQATAGALGRILVRMYGSPVGREFVASLPAGGEAESTLDKRFREPRLRNRVYAKTGTLRDTSSLAGYVRGESGRTYAFAVLCEGDVSSSRELQDAVVHVLAGQ